MSNKREFNFHYLENDEKTKKYNFSCNDDESISVPINQFLRLIGSISDDLAFYFNGSLLNQNDKIHIKDKFSGSGAVNIVAFPLRKMIEYNKNQKKPELNPSDKYKQTSEPVKKEGDQDTKISKEKKEEKASAKIEEKIEVEEKKFYNDIICPFCKTSAIIENNGMKLKIINCGNFHHLEDIRYDKFDEYEYDLNDISEENIKRLSETPYIKCNRCNQHLRYMTPPNHLYMCTCQITLCSACEKDHKDEGHYKVEVENINYKCLIHGKNFSSYCLDCNMNICDSCSSLHQEPSHEVLKFHNLKPKEEYIKELEKEIVKQQKILNNFYESSKKILDDIHNYLNKYIIIEKTFLNRYRSNVYNFQLLQNIRNRSLFYDNIIFQELKEFGDDKKDLDLKIKLDSLINVFGKMKNIYAKEKKETPIQKNNENKNQLIIKYQIKDPNNINRKVKIFDSVFVEKNKNKCEIEIKYKEDKQDKKSNEKLREYFDNKTNSEELTITLTENQVITDMSYMFNNCKSFYSVDFSKWTISNITNIESMFQLTNMIEIPKSLSNLMTTKLTNMRGLFCKCTHLETKNQEKLKFGNLNTQNVKDMSLLFNGCRKLKQIDLKGIDVRNVEDMSYMFSRCVELKEIHGLNNWKPNNLKNACGLFNKCEKLTILSNMGNWTMENVTDISIIFQFCESLDKLPDIHKWNLNKVEDISGAFSGCSKLKSPAIKNLYKLQLKSITSMCGLFNECTGLTTFPDVSNWNTDNVTDMSGLFCGCTSMTDLPPNINKWNISKVVDMSYIFDGCGALKDINSINHWNIKNVKHKTDALRGTNLPENVKQKWNEK